MKGVRIKILRDGRIEAETVGFTGESCLGLIPELEKLLTAQVTDSHITDEYFLDSRVQHSTGTESHREELQWE